ncbi:MAG: hypothetical protein IPN34_15480 [Planctomycetes bacterium]|nr:hypothetical protein [Planctomycetota bacterium]
MQRKLFPFAAACAALALLLALTSWLLREGEPTAVPTSAGVELEQAEEVTSPYESSAATASPRRAETETFAVPEAPAEEPSVPARFEIEGVVVAAEDRRPLTGVELRHRHPGQPLGVLLATTDAEGRFRCALDASRNAPGRVVLVLSAPRRRSLVQVVEALGPAERRELGILELAVGAELAGKIVDPSGAPIAGAVLNAVGEYATSDANGRFAFAFGMPFGKLGLHAMAGGFCNLAREHELPLREELVLVLERARSIEGYVLDEARKPIEGVVLYADASTTPRFATSDAAGRFSLFDPLGQETATHLHVQPGITELWRSKDPIPWGARDVVVELRRTLGLEIEVVDAETGSPIERYGVHFLPRTSRPQKGSLREMGLHEGGKLRLARVERGEMRLWIVPEEPRWMPHERQEVLIGENGAPPQRLALERRPRVGVQIIDDAGAPVGGAEVELLRSPLDRPLHPLDVSVLDDAGLLRSMIARPAILDQATSDATGQAELHSVLDRPQMAPPKSGLPPEVHPQLFVRAAKTGFAPTIAELPFASGEPKLRVVLARAAALRGRIEPARALELEPKLWLAPQGVMFSEAERVREEARLALDAEGRFSAEGLAPGAVAVRARFGTRWIAQPLAQIELQSGAVEEVVLDLSAYLFASASIEVSGAGEGQIVQFSEATVEEGGAHFTHERAAAKLDEHGRGELTRVPPGTYDVVLHSARSLPPSDSSWRSLLGRATFAADERQALRFEHRSRRLVIQVRRADGSLPPEGETAFLSEGVLSHGARFDEQGQLVFEPAPTTPFVLSVLRERHPRSGSYEPPPGNDGWTIEVTLRR